MAPRAAAPTARSFFVDTNLLVYARDAGAGSKQVRSMEWLEHLWRTGSGRLSRQVLNEYYTVVTGRLEPGLPVEEARADLKDLEAWDPLPLDAEVTRQALEIEDRYGFSWWDCLICAAAHMLNCAVLLTEDLRHGQTVGRLAVVDPFAVAPGDEDL